GCRRRGRRSGRWPAAGTRPPTTGAGRDALARSAGARDSRRAVRLARRDGRPRAAALALALLLTTVASCSTPPAALRADTLAYLQKMASWAPVEAETARTLERIMATQFVDEAEVRRQIAESAPRGQRQLETATAYEPRTAGGRRGPGRGTQ